MASLQALIVNVVNTLYAKEGETPALVEPIEFMPDHAGDLEPIKEKMKQEKLKRGIMRMVHSLGGGPQDSEHQTKRMREEEEKTKDKGASTL